MIPVELEQSEVSCMMLGEPRSTHVRNHPAVRPSEGKGRRAGPTISGVVGPTCAIATGSPGARVCSAVSRGAGSRSLAASAVRRTNVRVRRRRGRVVELDRRDRSAGSICHVDVG